VKGQRHKAKGGIEGKKQLKKIENNFVRVHHGREWNSPKGEDGLKYERKACRKVQEPHPIKIK